MSAIPLPDDHPLVVGTHLSQPFAQNAYVVRRRDEPSRTLVVDAGFEADALAERLRSEGREVTAVVATHGHIDHIAGNAAFRRVFPDAELVCARGDAAMLTDPALNLSALFGQPVVSPPADRLIDEGDTFESAGVSLRVRHVPGHSPGHVVLVWRPAEESGHAPMVFGGDCLFRGGIGRYDFPGGDGPLLVRGIREKLYCLPDATVVLPGHGPPTTVGAERRDNPFTTGRLTMA